MRKPNSILRSVLVHGRLAYAMRRAAAAREHEIGLQIMTPTLLAVRLAGGLLRPASRESIETGIRLGLSQPELLEDIGPIAELPGTARALLRTMRSIWRAGFDLSAAPYAERPRVRDLITIEETIRRNLRPGEHLISDLSTLARAAVSVAPVTVGSLRIEGIHTIDPIWRPLLDELRDVIDVEWHALPSSATSWFRGTLKRLASTTAKCRGVTCADPYHETLEAMRWARELLSSGRARAHEIAVTTTAPDGWDDYVLSLVSTSGLPVCFVHGRPALATRDGQRCAALADALHGGLSQARVRRLLSLVANQGTRVDALPQDGLPIRDEASLSTVVDWERALEPHPAVASVLLPVLRLVEKGPEAADEAGRLLLRGRSRQLWEEALRSAPASALMFSLQRLRVPDDRDPADAIAWCSADELAAAPRRFVWAMGLTTSGWPRSSSLDPLLPGYVVPSKLVDPDPIEKADRRCFESIVSAADEVTLSCARLTSEGKSIGASALMPPTDVINVLHRDRAPSHALTETDRLRARPSDQTTDPIVSSATAVWRDWEARSLTPHDGLVGKAHPLLSKLLATPQSPTSLARLLRDPLAYVWYYALGWRDLVHKERGLVLPADDMGRLVHELLRRAVDHLEPTPGFTRAAEHEIEEALELASAHVIEHWPLTKNVPPPVLWTNTVRQAAEMSLAGLTAEKFTESATRSWAEVPFGGEVREDDPPMPLPWDSLHPVVLPGTDVSIRGSIDRLDLRASIAVRVTDYKTGQRPRAPEQVEVDGGAELQRVLYALACRQLLAETKAVVTRLIYLRPPILACPLTNPDDLADRVASWVQLARTTLESGIVYPGVSTMPHRFGKIALPAALSYLDRKAGAIRAAAGRDLVGYWGMK